VNALDRLADTSFAWHMAEHLIPLFVLPLIVLLLNPFRFLSRRMSKKSTASLVIALRPMHVLANPVVALVVFTATLWASHFTPMYEYAMEHSWAHVAEHALYFVAGLLFWLPVIAPAPLRPPAYPVRLLYLAVAMPQGALLALAINGARLPLYLHYAHVSAAAAIADQHNAAAVMWLAGGLITFTAFLTTLAIWASRESDSPSSSAYRTNA